MPTYQYRCTECSEELEVVQAFADEPLTECPQCHGRLRKVFSPVGVVFKGSGFYKTDSRSSAAKKSSSDSSDTPSSSTSETPAKKSDGPAAGGSSDATGAGTTGGDRGKTSADKGKTGGGKDTGGGDSKVA
jgi:putative FmdB family regulatory protein